MTTSETMTGGAVEAYGRSWEVVERCWGYEALATFGGRAGGLVTPERGSLWPAREVPPRQMAGSIRWTRVAAVRTEDGALWPATSAR